MNIECVGVPSVESSPERTPAIAAGEATTIWADDGETSQP